MPTVNKPAGVVVPRRIGEPLQDGVSFARSEFGFGVMNPANPIREMVEAIGALPWDAREQDLVELALQFDPRFSNGQFLEAGVWPIAKRKLPTASAGVVNFNYKSIVTSPTPLFAAGDLEFYDGAGLRYTGTDDLDPPGLIFDGSSYTGVASETIGAGNPRIAQKVHIRDLDFPQALRFGGLVIVTGAPVANFRLETDSAGAPSGVLADPRLIVTAQALVAGANDVIFPKGAKIATGDYWLVPIVSGGTVTFDGSTGGTANQVLVYNGATWSASASVENLDVQLYNGGQFNVACTQLGVGGNIAPGSIGSVRANNGTAQTAFDTLVGTDGGNDYENLESFQGGRDLEGDDKLRNRARVESAARGTTSPGGIEFGMSDGTVKGISFIDIRNNYTPQWGTEETVLNNSGKTGSAGDLIDGVTYTRTAQRIVVAAHGSVSALAFKLNANSASTITFRLETDSAGSPSGTLLSPNFEKTGVVPGGTSRVAVTLAAGDFFDAGTYWLVAIRTAGTFRFDGSNSGATNNVKRYTGSAWQLSSALQEMNVEVYGGVPAKSWQPFVEGGSDDDVAQGLMGLGPPGIPPYGSSFGTALDRAGRAVIRYFNRIGYIDTVFDVTVSVTPAFTGSADDLRNLLVEYIAELGVNEAIVRQEAMGRLITGDVRTIGVFDVTLFRLGKKASFATPASLTGTEVVNLTDSYGERFRVANQATDIRVTIVAA